MHNHYPDNYRYLKTEFRIARLESNLRFTVIGIFVLFAGIAYYIYEDHANGLPAISVFFRLIPAVLAAALLAAILTPLRKHTSFIIVLYYACLFGLMAMMAGLLVIVAATPLLELYVLGTVLVVFCVYLCSLYGAKHLIPAYALPLAAALAIILYEGKVPVRRLLMLSNPFMAAFVCCLLAEVQHKLRLNEFSTMKITESQNLALHKELSLAQTVQRNLLPLRMPALKSVDIAVTYIPMIGIGGDLYDFIEFREQDAFGLFMCDVSGHGVSAALVSIIVKAYLSSVRRSGTLPSRLIRDLNDRLCGQIGDHYVTVFYGIYREKERSFTYSRGGHCYPLLVHDRQVHELDSIGGFLGRTRDMSFEDREVILSSGDRLLFYTDGIIEARDANGKVFGEERLATVLRNSTSLSNTGALDEIVATVKRFQMKEEFDDDVCVISMEVR